MTENNPEGVTLRTGIYGVFDEFLKESVIEKTAYFPKDNSINNDQKQNVFNPAVLNKLVDCYVQEPNKDKNIKFVNFE